MTKLFAEPVAVAAVANYGPARPTNRAPARVDYGGLAARHVVQRDPRPVSVAVLVRTARRLRLPGHGLTDCPAAVVTCARLACEVRYGRPTLSERLRAYWARMVARFALGEIVAQHDYHAGRENR